MRLDLSELDIKNFELSMSGLFPTRIVYDGKYAEGTPYRAPETGTFVWVDRYGLDCGEVHWEFQGKWITDADRIQDAFLLYLSEKPKTLKGVSAWDDLQTKFAL